GRLLRFEVGEGGEATSGAETKALGDLRIDVDVGAVPRAKSGERGGADGVLRLAGAREAVRTFVWRAEFRIALLDVGELAVDIPGVARDRPSIAARLRRRAGVPRAELVIEPEPQRLDVEHRLVARVRRKDTGDGSEAVVEIFDAHRPVRRYCGLGAETERPAGAGEQHCVLIAGDAGRLAEARLRPGKATGSVNQPMIERVAEATAQRRDIVDLVGNGGALRRRSCKGHAILEK